MKCPSTNQERLHCDQLLNAAEALLDERGVVSFRFAEMAKLANCSNHVLYKHFKSKEDVLVCMFLRNCTSSYIPIFLEQNPDIDPRLLAAMPAVFSWIAVQRSPTFNTLRVISINSMCWQMASDEKVSNMRQRVNLFWSRMHLHVEQAQQQGVLLEPESRVMEVTQSLYFFLAGIISSFESQLMDEFYLGDGNQTFYRQLTNQLNNYQWQQRFSVAELAQLGVKVEAFFNQHYLKNKSCRNCQRLNGITDCRNITPEIAVLA